ncbi:MAG: DinB family protein [Armatimonadetes bacterium]|nr:DinB family protein [Armatimonadota bacterium]
MDHYDVTPVEGMHPELGLLVATWRDSSREWRESLGEVSDAAVVWQPYPNGPSIGGLVLHMVACDLYWIEAMLFDKGYDSLTGEAVEYDKQVDQYVPHWPTPPAKPMAWYLDLLDKTRAEMQALVATADDPERILERGGRYSFTCRWVLAHALEHDSYHGGQAVLLHEMWKQTVKK